MRNWNVSAGVALGIVGLVAGSPLLAQSPMVQAFAAPEAMRSPALSPDGTRLAFISQNETGSYILVAELDGMKVTSVIDTADSRTRGVAWASGDALVFLAGVAANENFIPGQFEPTSPYGVDLGSGAEAQPLLRDRGNRGGGGPGRFGGVFGPEGSPLIGFERGTGRVLFSKFEAQEGDRVLYAVNPKNDQRTVLDRGPRNAVQWIVNEAGDALYRVDHDPRSNQLTLLGHATGRWEVVVTETLELPQLAVYGLDANANLVIGMRPRDAARFGLYALSTDTGRLRETPIYVHDRYDVASARMDPYTNRVIGANLAGEGTVWFDQEMANHQALLDETFPDESPRIASWSADRERFIVVTDAGDRAPGVYLYDAAAPSVDQIATTLTTLQNVRLPARRAYSYMARDGVSIPGYLTRPIDADGPTPLIVLPHGGPAARDVAGYDWLAHFLASRGYTVLQPNFRGSGGFGAAWEAAGFGQWGTGVMQHDLSDGVAALIAADLADADRVCILGISYGGYAALAGAVFTPQLYRCAAAVAPPTDLVSLLDAERDRRAAFNGAVAYWRRAMGGGDPAGLDARLRAASPAAHASQARAPILLIHAREDAVVPIAQSQAMERALGEAGKDVELVELEGGDHWLSEASTRLGALQAIDRFLEEHLRN